MDLTTLPLFKVIVARMGWLSQRQQVLSQNIANADTPGYRPLDMQEQDFARLLRPSVRPAVLERTSPAHLGPTRPPAQIDGTRPVAASSYEVAPDGNAVILEEQLMKVAATQSQYRLATNLYAKHVSMLKQAIGRGGR